MTLFASGYPARLSPPAGTANGTSSGHLVAVCFLCSGHGYTSKSGVDEYFNGAMSLSSIEHMSQSQQDREQIRLLTLNLKFVYDFGDFLFDSQQQQLNIT